MKKLILAGIVVIICCLVFLIVRQNSSQADIGRDIYFKTYPVRFGDWVYVYLASCHNQRAETYSLTVMRRLIEDKVRFRIMAAYNANTELGRQWYQEIYLKLKEDIRQACMTWTAQGYPISLNDFEFDITVIR